MKFPHFVQQKKNVIRCHKTNFLDSKYTLKALAAGALPRTPLGELKRFPRLPSLFEGAASRQGKCAPLEIIVPRLCPGSEIFLAPPLVSSSCPAALYYLGLYWHELWL